MVRTPGLVACVVLLVALASLAHAKYAYVTLMTGEAFISGTRVLGRSIRSTNTSHDMVVMVTEMISQPARELLRNDGWIVHDISSIRNPHEDHFYFKERLLYAFSKVYIFSLTDYSRVLYLDSDIMLTENVDYAFSCARFCAVVRNGFFNTGVMVVRPDKALFEDLISNYLKLPSYNGGEQGFMNSYFPHFEQCPFFDRTLVNPEPDRACARLPSGLNGDIGVYYLHDSHWVLPNMLWPPVIHYTMGPFKPWQWWSYLLIDLHWLWLERAHELSPPLVHSATQLPIIIVPIVVFVGFALLWRRGKLSAMVPAVVEVLMRVLPYLPRTFVPLLGPLVVLVQTGSAAYTAWVLLGDVEFAHPYLGWLIALLWFFVLQTLMVLPAVEVIYVFGQRTRGLRVSQTALPDALWEELLTAWASWLAFSTVALFASMETFLTLNERLMVVGLVGGGAALVHVALGLRLQSFEARPRPPISDSQA